MNPKYSRYYTYIKPLVNNNAIRNYSFLVFSVITSLIFAIFAIQPTIQTIIAIQKSINEQNDALKQAEKKVQDLNLGKTNYDNLDPKIKINLSTMVPPSIAFPALIKDLSSLAFQNEASLSGIQFQPAELSQKIDKISSSPTVATLDLTINVQGSYNNLVNFLNTLNNFNHLVSINSANFIKPTEGNLLLTISATTYYLKN